MEEGGVEDECQFLGLRDWGWWWNSIEIEEKQTEDTFDGSRGGEGWGHHLVKWAGRRLQVAEPAEANAVRTEERVYLNGREHQPSTRVPMFELTHRPPQPHQ